MVASVKQIRIKEITMFKRALVSTVLAVTVAFGAMAASVEASSAKGGGGAIIILGGGGHHHHHHHHNDGLVLIFG